MEKQMVHFGCGSNSLLQAFFGEKLHMLIKYIHRQPNRLSHLDPLHPIFASRPRSHSGLRVVILESGNTIEKLYDSPKHLKSGPDYKFVLTTKKRTYYWGTQNEETCLKWINTISGVIGSLWEGE
eukprot:sb/3475644/